MTGVPVLPALPGPSLVPQRRRRRRQRGYYRRQAKAIYELQMREAVMRWTHEKVPDPDIARRLGQTVSTIKKYRRESIERSAKRAAFTRTFEVPATAVSGLPSPYALPAPEAPKSGRAFRAMKQQQRRARYPRAYWPDGSGVGQDGGRTVPALPPGSTDPSDPPRWSSSSRAGGGVPPTPPPPPRPPGGGGGSSPHEPDEILDPPDIVQLRKDCLMLRKSMIPFDIMAMKLGITEQEAKRYTAEALKQLTESEMMNADLERRLMIEQLDQMIAAIHPMSTGFDLQHGQRPVVLEAIDRMLKLMQKKADLLGISHVPASDIRLRLQALAEEQGYDILDLEDIARDVLQAHKIRLPEFRG